MLKTAEAGQFDTLIVDDLSQLSRDNSGSLRIPSCLNLVQAYGLGAGHRNPILPDITPSSN